MEAQHRELKILLGVLVFVIIGVVAGSVVMNRRSEAEGKRRALEEALELAKSQMEENGDSMLVDSIEIESVEVIRERRDEVTYEIAISIPDLKEVYDQLYDRLIEEEVWRSTSPGASLRTIHGESIESASREPLYLKEEVKIRKKDRGQWEAENPEAFYLVLPREVLPIIEEDMTRVMKALDDEPEYRDYPEGSLEEEFQDLLKENDFFTQVNFHVEALREGEEIVYSFGFQTNNLHRLSTIGEAQQYRHRRDEIFDRESLINILWEELQEASDWTNTLHRLRVRPYERPYDENHGFEAVFRDRQDVIYLHGYTYGPDALRVPQLYLSDLEGYYSGHRPELDAPWPEPLLLLEFEKENILARDYNGETLAFIMEEDRRLIFRTYDGATGEKTGEAELTKGDVPWDDHGVDLTHHYEIQERNGVYLLKYNPWKSTVQVAEPTSEGIMLHPHKATDFHGVMSNDLFYVGETLFYFLSRYEYGNPATFYTSLKNLSTGESVEEREIRGTFQGLHHFFSEKHGVLMNYPVSLGEEEEPDFSDEELFRIYDLKNGEVLRDTEITEHFSQEVFMELFHPLDEDRILIKTHVQDWWVADLRDFSLTPVESPGPVHRERANNGEDQVHRHTTLTPMEENYFLATEYQQGPEGMIPVRVIVFLQEEVEMKPIFSVDFLQERTVTGVSYQKEGNILLVTGRETESEEETLDVRAFDLSYEQLDRLGGQKTAYSFQQALEKGVLKESMSFRNVNDTMDGSMFRLSHDFLQPYNNLNLSKGMYYDRDQERVILITNTFTRELRHDDRPASFPSLWGYDVLEIDHDHEILYYEDERGVFLYGLEEFFRSWGE